MHYYVINSKMCNFANNCNCHVYFVARKILILSTRIKILSAVNADLMGNNYFRFQELILPQAYRRKIFLSFLISLFIPEVKIN